MSGEPATGPLPPPWLHPETGAVWFWVAQGAGAPMGAILSREVLRYRYLARADGSDSVSLYHAHREEIEQAVQRRVATGSIEPVVLRENDLRGAVSP